MATGSALAVLYGLYHASNGHPVTLAASAFYNAVNRQVWGACVAWVVIACVTGNGGSVTVADSSVSVCTLSHFGPHIWNNLPQDIRHSATLFSFKSQLKTFLFSEYFS